LYYIKSLRHKQKILLQIIFISMKEWSAYRVDMLMLLLTAPLAMLAQYFIWNSVYSTNKTINGMSLNQILTYYAITTILNAFLNDDMATTLRSNIYNGSLSTILQKPVSYFLYSFSQKIGKKTISLLIEVLPLAIIFILAFKINIMPQNLIWAIISIALSFIHVFFVNFCIGITAFWLIDNWGITMSVNVLSSLCSGMLIPLVFFPQVIQKLLFILPFQFMYYIPTRVILGSYELAGISMVPYQIVLMQFVYVFIMGMATYYLWIKGIKKYTGVGA